MQNFSTTDDVTTKHAKLHKIIENADDKTLLSDVDDEKSDDSSVDSMDECEDEEGSAVTYSFTLGNNVPLVVQTVTSEVVSDKNEENEADNKNYITIITKYPYKNTLEKRTYLRKNQIVHNLDKTMEIL